MATIPSTPDDFRKDLSKFIQITGVKTTPPEAIKGAYRAITLRYLGLTDATKEDIETCAMLWKIAVDGAVARGWELE